MYTVSQKKQDTLLLSIMALLAINRFSKIVSPADSAVIALWNDPTVP